MDAETLTVDELEQELASLASHLYAGMCRWLELVAEVDRRGAMGCTCSEWLAWRCGLTPRTAREHVRVARVLKELPLIRAAFGRGEISFAKVRALTRIAEPESEAELLGLALELTAAQLERAVRAYRRVTTDEAVAAQENAYLQWYWDEDGSLVLRGQLAPEDGAVFLQAIESAHQTLRERGSAEPRQTNADALVAMAELALSGGSRSGGGRHQVVVHVEEGVLGDDTEGGCELDDGPALAPETARRLACDSSVVRVREREGKTLSVGRKTRSVPSAVRRALKRRDRGCCFPGCENRLFVDAHHIRHWAHGGETNLDNLVLLCRRHHRLVHEGGYSVERLPDDELRFRDPWGALVPNAPRPPPGSIEPLLTDGVGTYAIAWPDRMDLDLAVQALLAATA
jgi:5-methylcytosine-specific restriction endonuclease McrA